MIELKDWIYRAPGGKRYLLRYVHTNIEPNDRYQHIIAIMNPPDKPTWRRLHEIINDPFEPRPMEYIKVYYEVIKAAPEGMWLLELKNNDSRIPVLEETGRYYKDV